MHHHRSLHFISMITWLFEEIFWIAHLEPLTGSNDEIRKIHSQITNHILEGVSSMTIHDEEFLDSLMLQRFYDILQNCLLSLISVMDTESHITLSGILGTHSHRRKHHAIHAFVGSKLYGSIHCDAM